MRCFKWGEEKKEKQPWKWVREWVTSTLWWILGFLTDYRRLHKVNRKLLKYLIAAFCQLTFAQKKSANTVLQCSVSWQDFFSSLQWKRRQKISRLRGINDWTQISLVSTHKLCVPEKFPFMEWNWPKSGFLHENMMSVMRRWPWHGISL